MGRALIRQPQHIYSVYQNNDKFSSSDATGAARCVFHSSVIVARLLPITLGQVFQRIDVVSKDFGNIVDVELGGPWLLLPVEIDKSETIINVQPWK
ncbi:hypothetical protein OsJ_17975 [Oryza sativa Japonica Group]|uniref:Uncharacterized protein n=1 Tax=Oryza sativa subsp. japonica TaxID=39947 RepID=B9FKD8_ORYSJ|nr:hypothetical protein OsJ_17975 [Oryza sativa Japonica Group]